MTKEKTLHEAVMKIQKAGVLMQDVATLLMSLQSQPDPLPKPTQPKKPRKVTRRKVARKAKPKRKITRRKKLPRKKVKRPMSLSIYEAKHDPDEALRLLGITLHDVYNHKEYNVELRTTKKYFVEYGNRFNTWLVGGKAVKLNHTSLVDRFIKDGRKGKDATCKLELSLGKSFLTYQISRKAVRVILETDNKDFAKKWKRWTAKVEKKYGAEFSAKYGRATLFLLRGRSR